MNFAAPTMLWWLLLAVPAVALYVLKVRLRRVPVSTLMFWDRVYQEKAPRSLFERLRHLASLLCQLLLIALLAFALADPFTDSEAGAARRLVLVLDTSAGMAAAVDPDDPAAGTRLDAAKARALSIVRGLRHRDAAAVLTAGADAAVACGTTNHPPTLAAAIQNARQTDAPGAVADALALARRLVAGRENGRVLLFSDRDPPASAVESEEGNVVLLPFGEPGGNVAITAFQTRRSLTDPVGYEILVEVANFSDAPAAYRLDLDLAGVPVDVVPLELAPGETWRRTFEKTDESGGELTAKLVFESPPQAVAPAPQNLLTADDAARAVLPARDRVPVVLVTPGNLFLQQVFAANPLVDLFVESSVPAEVPPGAVLVLHQIVPAELPPGPVFVVDPRGDCELFTVGDEIAAPSVKATAEAEGSPLLANVRLDRIEIPKARVVTPAADADATPLVETADGSPLFFTARRSPSEANAGGKALVLAVDFDATDLPLRTAFPILAVNALTWFTDAAGELRPAAATGEVVTVPLPAGADSAAWSVVPPSGVADPLPAGLSEVTLGPLADAGLWHVAPVRPPESDPQAAFPNAAGWPDGTIPVAVNLTDPDESDTRLAAPRSESADPAGAAGGRPWWFWLTAAALALVGAEWWLYQRRFIQ